MIADAHLSSRFDRYAARLVVGHGPARARGVGLLGFPGDDAALDVDLPRARTGAVDAVGGAYHLVVRPTVTVGVFPGAVFTVRNAEALGETFLRVREIVQSIKKVTHFDSPEAAAGGSHNCLIRLLLSPTNVAIARGKKASRARISNQRVA